MYVRTVLNDWNKATPTKMHSLNFKLVHSICKVVVFHLGRPSIVISSSFLLLWIKTFSFSPSNTTKCKLMTQKKTFLPSTRGQHFKITTLLLIKKNSNLVLWSCEGQIFILIIKLHVHCATELFALHIQSLMVNAAQSWDLAMAKFIVYDDSHHYRSPQSEPLY